MTRRTVRRPGRPHVASEDPNAPESCICGLPMAARNDRHLAELPATDPDVRTTEARRMGERD